MWVWAWSGSRVFHPGRAGEGVWTSVHCSVLNPDGACLLYVSSAVWAAVRSITVLGLSPQGMALYRERARGVGEREKTFVSACARESHLGPFTCSRGGCGRVVAAAKLISPPVSLLSLCRCSGSSRDGCPGGVQDTGGGLRNLPHHGGQHQRQLRGVAALRGGAALLWLLQQPQRAVPPHADPRPARPGEALPAATPSSCAQQSYRALSPSAAPRCGHPYAPKPHVGRARVRGSCSHLCPLCGHAEVRVTSVPAAGRSGAVQQLGTVTRQSCRALSPSAAPCHGPSCSSRRPCLLC